MIGTGRGRSFVLRRIVLRPIRAVSSIPSEASEGRLTQRRVIDLKRYAVAACCRCC